MVKIEGLIHGIYPKSEKLRIRIGRWERGLIRPEELDAIIKEETEDFEKLAGNNLLHTDPLFNWYDIFRPITLISEGMTLGPLTRFEETNTFYRIPLIHSLPRLNVHPEKFLELDENPPLPLYHVSGRWIAFLPGLQTFYAYSRNIGSLPRETFFQEMGKIYSEILSKFSASSVFFMERVPVDRSVVKAYSEISDPEKTIIFTTGKLSESAFTGSKSKFQSIIVDPERDNLKLAAAHSLVPGLKLIDGRNTKMETGSSVKEKVSELSSGISAERVIVTNSDYLDFLPRSVADKKVALLSGGLD